MGMKGLVGNGVDRAMSFVDSLRAAYQSAYEKATALVSNEGGAEGKLESAQQLIDNLNQALADKAIPSCRKASVTQRRIEERSPQRTQMVAPRKVSVKKASAVIASASTTAKSDIEVAQKPMRKKSVSAKTAPTKRKAKAVKAKVS